MLLRRYRSSVHQFGLEVVAASVIPPQGQSGFRLFLLGCLNVDLGAGLFLLQWVWLYFLLGSAGSFLGFYVVEAGSLFDVIAGVGGEGPIGGACLVWVLGGTGRSWGVVAWV